VEKRGKFERKGQRENSGRFVWKPGKREVRILDTEVNEKE